jgi:succinoglycan biosynthesis transport protein ExoP
MVGDEMNESMGQEPGTARDWDGSAPSLRSLLTTVFKRRRLILCVFLISVLVTTLVTILMPPVYEAAASILVKKSSAEMPLIPTDSSQLIISQITETDLNSEIMILKSRDAIEETLRKLGAADDPPPPSPLDRLRRTVNRALGIPPLSYFDDLVLNLEKKIEVSPLRKSNVLQIKYKSTDPVWAMKVVQGLAERYVTRRTQLYQSPKAEPFFEEEMQQAGARLQKAEAALEAYSKKAGVSVLGNGGDGQSLAAEKEAALSRLASFESQYGDAAVQVQQQTDRVSALEGQLKKEPERLPSVASGNQDPTTAELEKALVTLQLKRDALAQDFTPENRQVKDVDDQIKATQARLNAAEAKVASINRTQLNSVYQSLRGQLLVARADLDGAKGRYQSLAVEVANQRRQLMDLDKKGLTTDALRREVRAAEDAYMMLRKKHEEARITAAMDQQRIVNVSIAQPAERPLRPVAPKKSLNLLLGLLFGLAGGFAIAFVVESLDHSFTTGHDLEARLGIPLLGAIPDHKPLGRNS